MAIVGAGPAGSAAAFACAALGLRTLIVEKSRFPRDKVCGGCISPHGMRCLEDMGVDQAVRNISAPIRSFSITARNRSLRLHLDQTGVAVGRDVLDSMLLEHAIETGVVALQGASASLIGHSAAGCRFAVTRQGDSDLFLAKAVIVADGLAGSFLPRSGDWMSVVSSDSYFGIGARLSPGIGRSLCDAGTIAMRCGSAGYFGAVRLRDGAVDVAAALSPAQTKRLGGPGRAMRALAMETGACDAAEVLEQIRWRGTALLTRRRRVEKDHIFVVGDAASYVEPFTGEGMSWGLAAGLRVAACAQAAIAGTYRVGDWTREWTRLADRRRIACRLTALALRHPGLVSATIGLAKGLPSATGLVASVVSGPWSGRGSEPVRI